VVRLENEVVGLKANVHQEKMKIQRAAQKEILILRTEQDVLSARHTVLEASAAKLQARLNSAEAAVSKLGPSADDDCQREIDLQAREAQCREREDAIKQDESKLIVKLLGLLEEVKSRQTALDLGYASIQRGIYIEDSRLEAIDHDERVIAAREAVLATTEKEIKESEEAKVHVNSRMRASTSSGKRKAVEIDPTQSTGRAPKSERSEHADAGTTRVTNARDTVAAIRGDKITNVEGGHKLEEA